MKKIIYILILICIGTSVLFSIENGDRPILSHYSSDEKTQSESDSSKKFPFLSCAALYGIVPLPGVGLSTRNNGKATDISAHSLLAVNTLSYTFSKIHYKNSASQGAYSSFGAGAMLGMLTLKEKGSAMGFGLIFPIRAGHESDNNFWDVGIELGVLGIGGGGALPIISPEIRGGLKF